MKYEGVLFDFDGVLADTEPLHFEAWRNAARNLGMTFDWTTYRDNCIGLSERDTVRVLTQLAGRPELAEDLWAEYPRKAGWFRDKVLANPPILSEAKELLEELKGYKLAVVTSTAKSEVQPVLERAGIADRFAACVYAEDVPHHKPDPAPYREAARRLGITRALVVEDSDAGVASGRAAGFDVLRIGTVAEMPELVRAALKVAISKPSLADFR